MIEKDNVKFIKLRLKDSNIWSKIIGNIMGRNYIYDRSNVLPVPIIHVFRLAKDL